MNYVRTDWKDHIVEKPKTYRMVQNDDGTITLFPENGEIYQQGTSINATNLNHIEEGLEVLDQNAVQDKGTLAGGSDLNDYIGIDKKGNYYVSNTSDIINAPISNNSGVLQVLNPSFAADRTIQIFTAANRSMFLRWGANDAWTEWTQLASNKDLLFGKFSASYTAGEVFIDGVRQTGDATMIGTVFGTSDNTKTIVAKMVASSDATMQSKYVANGTLFVTYVINGTWSTQGWQELAFKSDVAKQKKHFDYEMYNWRSYSDIKEAVVANLSYFSEIGIYHFGAILKNGVFRNVIVTRASATSIDITDIYAGAGIGKYASTDNGATWFDTSLDYWTVLAPSDIITPVSGVGIDVNNCTFYKKNGKIMGWIAGTGSIKATSGANILILFNIKPAYRPKTIGQFFATRVNKNNVSGQVQLAVNGWTNSSGDCYLILPENNVSYGNATYPWSTDTKMYVEWEL